MPSMDIKKSFIYMLVIFILLLPILALLPQSMADLARTAGFELMDKTGLSLTLSPVDPTIKALSADPANSLVLKATVRDSDGNPVKGAKVYAKVSGSISSKVSASMGSVTPANALTDSEGVILLQYSPPFLGKDAFSGGNPVVRITAGIPGAKAESSYTLSLVHIPVVFVHGYQANPDIFSSMKDYLDGKGFDTTGFGYDSAKGVASGAAGLDKFITGLKKDYMQKGISIAKVDIIAHSMGGLVARYYTCSAGYPSKGDVNKIIFVSVPQMGSPIATLGLQYYNDQAIHDLMPDSPLLTSKLPSMINGGLNSSVQVSSILGQYDEVVSPESASLEKWGIRTEMFDVGDSNFTVDKLLSGQLAEAANHKVVLYNKTVFRRIEEMLGSVLPYPVRK